VRWVTTLGRVGGFLAVIPFVSAFVAVFGFGVLLAFAERRWIFYFAIPLAGAISWLLTREGMATSDSGHRPRWQLGSALVAAALAAAVVVPFADSYGN
jgi:hypothetical protein